MAYIKLVARVPNWYLKPVKRRYEFQWTLNGITFVTAEKRCFMSEMLETDLGFDGLVTFLKADGSPAKIDGDPRWSIDKSADGNDVASLEVNPNDPFKAVFKPLPIPNTVAGSGHTAQGKVEGDGDLDAGEERLVTALFTITVIRAEAVSAGVELTPITIPTPPPDVPPPSSGGVRAKK